MDHHIQNVMAERVIPTEVVKSDVGHREKRPPVHRFEILGRIIEPGVVDDPRVVVED